MANRHDVEDRKLSLGLFLGLMAIIVVAALVAFFLAGPTIIAALAPGIGLRLAAIIAFVISLIVLIVMAVASGDGVMGELPFMLLGFAAFFLVCWLMIAWIF